MKQFLLKQTEDWQKTYTMKTVRKTHKELSRKGREVIRLRSIPLGGDTKEKRDYKGSEIIPGK